MMFGRIKFRYIKVNRSVRFVGQSIGNNLFDKCYNLWHILTNTGQHIRRQYLIGKEHSHYCTGISFFDTKISNPIPKFKNFSIRNFKGVSKLTFNAFISLWNSFSQNRGSDSKMEFSVTVDPRFLSSQSDSGSLDCCKKLARAISIALLSPDLMAASNVVLASVIL